MGPNARLDIVEYASDVGAPAAYDISVVTPLKVDAGFREACASEAGLAAEQRHAYKLSRQYSQRRPGSILVPLVAEIGGRWHPTVPRLVRKWAKEAADRSNAPDPVQYAAALTARWAARLSALLMRGNAAVQRTLRRGCTASLRPWHDDAGPLPHLAPVGTSSYELMCTLLPQCSDDELE